MIQNKDGISYNISQFNPLESVLHLCIQKEIHVFKSLARLAYSKGTALFRGNDPLQRSAAVTFSLTMDTHPHRCI